MDLMEEIEEKLNSYRDALQMIGENRMVWQKDTQSLIQTTLEKVVKQKRMAARVIAEKKMEGMEVVYLTYGKQPSGISEVIDAEVKIPLMKEGGNLFYLQTYNGKISVGITLPSIENVMPKMPPTIIDVYAPDKITEDVILSHVKQFIEGLTEWENQDKTHPEIGFNQRKK